MSQKMNPVVHFEMPAEDRKRMADFYTKVFGWKADFLGPEMGEYVTVQTVETGPDRRPTQPGAINGGFFLRTEDKKSQYPSVVISVDDIQKAMDDVKKAGGTIDGEPQDIPGVGAFVSMIDTEGNRVSLLQPKTGM